MNRCMPGVLKIDRSHHTRIHAHHRRATAGTFFCIMSLFDFRSVRGPRQAHANRQSDEFCATSVGASASGAAGWHFLLHLVTRRISRREINHTLPPFVRAKYLFYLPVCAQFSCLLHSARARDDEWLLQQFFTIMSARLPRDNCVFKK